MAKVVKAAFLLCALLFIASWIRVQGVNLIPHGRFTETDAYLYYWQAKIISEHGKLPERDMSRWLPIGRDLGQTLNLYGYALAYGHKILNPVFPKLTLYHVTLYAPVVCFAIGLAALYLFLCHTYGPHFSFIVGALLATLPGSIERSTAGFGDRDAWCLMLGILAVIIHLTSLQAQSRRKRLLWTLTSGFTVCLGGISWEGFGVFLSIILLVELWNFLTSETRERLVFYLIWVSTFVPTLYFGSPAYRSGYGFAKHLAAFFLIPPLIILAARIFRFLIITNAPRIARIVRLENPEKIRTHARAIALGLTLGCIACGLSYLWIQHNSFADTTVPLSKNVLMQSMTELAAPHYNYWSARYGTVFILGSLGFIIIPLSISKKYGWFLSVSIFLFTIFSFFRQPLDKIWGQNFGNTLFRTAIAATVIALLFVAWKNRNKIQSSKLGYLAFTGWFILWVALARDAKRYDFFIGVALAFGTAVLLEKATQMLSRKFANLTYSRPKFRETLTSTTLKTAVITILLAALLCLPINHAHTYRSLYAATQMRSVLPTDINIALAFLWMKIKLPKTAVVAAHWRYGSQLNVIADVKTIIDQDTYLQQWIYLYYKHVLNAKTEREALEFLKTHAATHLMLVGKKPAKHFLNGQLSKAFLPVYPAKAFDDADVNVWEIHYPPDIQRNPKYLLTGFQEIDDHLHLE